MLEAIPSRHRPLALLAAVVVLQVLLLAFQIKRDHDVRLVRVWAVELLTPLQRAGSWTIRHIGSGWHNYIGLRHARQENDQLRAQMSQLELRNQALEGQAAEAERLAHLLGFVQVHADVPMLAAQVIGASAVATSQTVYINRGEREGVRRDMGVITPEGVVGKIVEVFPHTASVLLMTDRDSGVGALLATSRTRGIVMGTGEPFARMEYVTNDEKVADGEAILTSGLDRIFPKDLPVGTVEGTAAGSPFQVIRVRPAARLDRLEEVLVLLTHKEFVTQPSTGPGPQSGTQPTSPPTEKPPTSP